MCAHSYYLYECYVTYVVETAGVLTFSNQVHASDSKEKFGMSERKISINSYLTTVCYDCQIAPKLHENA